MKEFLVSGNTLPEAYHKAIQVLFKHGEIVECPDYNTKQVECSMTVFVANPIKEPRISKLMFGGAKELQSYLMEMIDGSMDFMIGKTTSFPYTYHSRFSPYLDFIVTELQRNPLSRRAVISVRDNDKDTQTNDPACLNLIQFFIRNNKLDMQVLFRSNDLVKAFYFNAFALIELQQNIAKKLNIEIGTYTHRANSCHCYERDFSIIKSMNDRISYDDYYNNGNGLIYKYDNFYKDLMEEEIVNIQNSINSQKVKYNII